MQVEVISTGALTWTWHWWSLPRGRVIECFGPEGSGKSTLAMHVVAESQKLGGTCAYVDVENALDPSYAGTIGVNVDDLWVSQPDSGEQALEIVDRLIKSGSLAVIVIDSVAALVPRAESMGNGRCKYWPTGPADEPGSAQDHRQP